MVNKSIVSETQRLLSIYGKMTERQIYYKLISKGIGKSGKSFANYVSRVLCKARRSYSTNTNPTIRVGINPSLIIDTSREIRYVEPSFDVPSFAQNLDSRTQNTIDEQFILDLWTYENAIPVIVLEKFALGEIFGEVTRPYGVPLVVNRGFTSDSKLFELSQLIPSTKSVIFQTYSDYDTSGQHMYLSLQKTAKYYIQNSYFVQQCALTIQQVQNPKYNLHTIPKTYKRSGTTNQICELDALDPNDLKQIIKDNIEKHISNTVAFKLRIQETTKGKQKLRKMYSVSPSLRNKPLKPKSFKTKP